MGLFSKDDMLLLKNSHKNVLDDLSFYKTELHTLQKKVHLLTEQMTILQKRSDLMYNLIKGKKICLNVQTMQLEMEELKSA